MRILLVSLGSIGRRHLVNLRQLEPAAEVCILRRAIDPLLNEKQVTTLDAALAFAFLNVMREKGLVDQVFLDEHVLGAEELEASIDSMPLAKAAKLCGVSADLIEAAATAYATGPSLLWLGQGVQRQHQGGNVFRALAALIAQAVAQHGAAPAAYVSDFYKGATFTARRP